MNWSRFGRMSLIMVAGLVLTVGCRSADKDRIRYLESENDRLARESQSASEDLASEKSRNLKLSEDLEKTEADKANTDAMNRALLDKVGNTTVVTPMPAGVSEQGNRIIVPSSITFQPGQATLTKKAEKVLAQVAKAMQERQYTSIVIEGHTDSDPIRRSGWKNNEELSAARAKTVRAALSDHGIERTLIQIEGFGASRPVAKNDTAANKSRNRRVEIVLIQP